MFNIPCSTAYSFVRWTGEVSTVFTRFYFAGQTDECAFGQLVLNKWLVEPNGPYCAAEVFDYGISNEHSAREEFFGSYLDHFSLYVDFLIRGDIRYLHSFAIIFVPCRQM